MRVGALDLPTGTRLYCLRFDLFRHSIFIFLFHLTWMI